jgi:L-asparaginase
MAYSASVLSFMLENLDKPVIFTGSQLPLGMIRTDGKENLITAVEIAAARENGKAMVPEVCIYFENHLFRGNRTTKVSAENFNAFNSPNLLPLAEAGVNIKYRKGNIISPTIRQDFRVYRNLETGIALLKIHPSITREQVKSILESGGLKGLILESYGNGNCPTETWFLDLLSDFTSKGGFILNVTQCQTGSVTMGIYETSRKLQAAGVISGRDMTSEAALTKLMHLLGNYSDAETINKMLYRSLRGEITM